MHRPLAALALLAGVLLSGPASASVEDSGKTRVVVLVPDGDNLQYLPFWVAQGAGFFANEGVDADVLVPEIPAQAIARMIAGDAPVGVLPPPVYLQLVADRFPIVLVANLLRNDPIDLVVRRSVFEERHMLAAAPLKDRLLSLHGLRVCVAPGPPPRLRALFASVGLDADRDVDVVIRRGPMQNRSFAAAECDALYAHTPYLETAIDDQDAVMLVDQSAGEVPVLASRQIHALAVRRDFLLAHRATVVSLVRAIARAETLIHTDPDAASDAVLRALPALDRRHVRTIVGIYQPAVPDNSSVTAEGFASALALFPAGRTPPSLDGVPLGEFVEPSILEQAPASPGPPPAQQARSPRSTRWMLAVAAGVGIGGMTVVWLRRRRA